MSSLSGIAVIALGGLLSGLFTAPMKLVERYANDIFGSDFHAALCVCDLIPLELLVANS